MWLIVSCAVLWIIDPVTYFRWERDGLCPLRWRNERV